MATLHITLINIWWELFEAFKLSCKSCWPLARYLLVEEGGGVIFSPLSSLIRWLRVDRSDQTTQWPSNYFYHSLFCFWRCGLEKDRRQRLYPFIYLRLTCVFKLRKERGGTSLGALLQRNFAADVTCLKQFLIEITSRGKGSLNERCALQTKVSNHSQCWFLRKSTLVGFMCLLSEKWPRL